MLKRILDVVIASTALVLLSPVYALAYKVKKNLVLPYFFAKRVRAYMDSRLK
jgi:lipopolysaccharide/colanic/teichoic acid biosynthesis glycosyltransferase